jgi:hypothetical protein
MGIVASDETADSNALISAKCNLSGCRMFTKWDAEKKRAYTTITLMITLKSNGASFTLNNTDSLTFSMEIVTLRAVDSKNRVWSVNSPKVATSQKCTVGERCVIKFLFCLIPCIGKNTTLTKCTYCLNGQVVDTKINWKCIVVSPSELKCH